jgi:hypothetical protein
VAELLADRHALRVHARTSANSLHLRQGMAYDAWAAVGASITRITNASCWWMGDWIVYGEQAYGRRYVEAVEATDLDYQTLRNYAWIARRFQPSRRRTDVSFQHHAEVAALPEADQDLWLDRCARLRWSRNELRRQLRAAGRAQTDRRAQTHAVRVPLTSDRERLWREAAAAADQDLADWIAAAADEAAQATLGSAAA